MQAVRNGRIRITQALLGEHGAIYPLLTFIEKTAPSASLESIHIQAQLLHSTLATHAGIEDVLLRPAIEQHLLQTAPNPDGTPGLTDHQIINAGLEAVLAADTAAEASRLLLDTLAKTRKHFAKEETIIFGIAERELSNETQERLGAEWAASRNVFAA
jgi:hemerythrin-like domain-containing protein